MTARTWITEISLELELYSEEPGMAAESLIGVIDTGASAIVVDSRITKQLGLVAGFRKPVEMADGRISTSGVYPARLVISKLDFDDVVLVCGLDMDYPSHRVLLGRSFLKRYILNYNGSTEICELHEPETQPSLFLADHDE